MPEFATSLMIAAAPITAAEEIFRLCDPGEPALSVRHAPGPGPSVLYVHGSTFSAALSINYRIDGKSWADDLQARGLDVWSFDLAGYGNSEHRASMQYSSVPRENAPGRAADAASQIERVARYIRSQTHHKCLSIIAHSWGTIPAGLFTRVHPEWVEKLVLFAPVARRDGHQLEAGRTAPTNFINAEHQWQSFQSRVPMTAPVPISKDRFDVWAKAYLASDPTSNERTPSSARAPAGPDVDFNAAWNGHFPYDPATVRTPTLIVRGEWDSITRDADAAWLVNAMKNVPGGAQDVKLPRGAHRMHLEENREALFDAVGDFLAKDGR